MAFFVNPSSKFERAVRALLVLQGKATWLNTRVGNDSSANAFPNRKFVVSSFNPIKRYRPEGWATLDIQHYFSGIDQPDQAAGAQAVAANAFLGDTMDTLNLGGDNDQEMRALADAITAAGRWLAVADDPAEGCPLAADNADMLNFRCDQVRFGTPMITRGHPDSGDAHWVEIIHLEGFCSHASA